MRSRLVAVEWSSGHGGAALYIYRRSIGARVRPAGCAHVAPPHATGEHVGPAMAWRRVQVLRIQLVALAPPPRNGYPAVLRVATAGSGPALTRGAPAAAGVFHWHAWRGPRVGARNRAAGTASTSAAGSLSRTGRRGGAAFVTLRERGGSRGRLRGSCRTPPTAAAATHATTVVWPGEGSLFSVDQPELDRSVDGRSQPRQHTSLFSVQFRTHHLLGTYVESQMSLSAARCLRVPRESEPAPPPRPTDGRTHSRVRARLHLQRGSVSAR